MSAVQTHIYNPNSTHIHEGALITWLQAKDLSDLQTVPGIGPVAKDAIINGTKDKHYPITSGYGLLGYFLIKKKPAETVVQHVNRFYSFLVTNCGITTGNAQTITRAIAEKANLMMEGLYTINAFAGMENMTEVQKKEAAFFPGKVLDTPGKTTKGSK